jgi:hypothetical protein
MSKKELKKEYEDLLSFMQYTLHELPAGVLFGANGASEKECAELMAETYRLEQLSEKLGTNISTFIEGCRWHYERYPHYIGRHRHFDGYESYIAKHDGPLRVQS